VNIWLKALLENLEWRRADPKDRTSLSTSSRSPRATPAQAHPHAPSPSAARHLPNPLATIEPILRRDEADILFIAGNVALVALEVIEWPVAAIALALHLMARSRFKALQAVAEVAEEAE